MSFVIGWPPRSPRSADPAASSRPLPARRAHGARSCSPPGRAARAPGGRRGPVGGLGGPLLRGAAARRGRAVPGVWRAVGLVTLAGCALSVAIELTQNLLPGRVPTVQDVVLNTAGALLGAVLVAAVLAVGAARRTAAPRR